MSPMSAVSQTVACVLGEDLETLTLLTDRNAYQSVRSRSTDFGQVGFEPEQVPTTRKSAFYLGF